MSFDEDAHEQALELCECAGEPVSVSRSEQGRVDTWGIYERSLQFFDDAGLVIFHDHVFSLPTRVVEALTRGDSILKSNYQQRFQVLQVVDDDGFMMRVATAPVAE